MQRSFAKWIARWGVVAAAVLPGIGLVAPVAASADSTTGGPVSSTPNSSWSPWKSCPNKPGDNCAMVRAITRTPSGTVFLGGSFTELRSPDGKQRIAVSNLAALDDSGTPVQTFRAHNFNGTIFTLANDGNTIYAGGAFSKIDGKGVLHLARFDATTGARLTFRSGVKGTVYGSVLANGKLYIGGKFAAVQGVARGNLAALDPSTGAVDPAWTPDAELIPNDKYPNNPEHNNVPIRSLAASADGSRIYIAGDMDLLNGRARPAIAAVNPVTGANDPTFTPGIAINKTFQGMDIAVVDSSSGLTPGIILAAGGLTNKAWRLNTDGTIAWTVNLNGDAQAAAVMGDTVYLGGHFDCVSAGSCFDNKTSDDIPRMHIAAFSYDGSGNRTPDPSWSPALGPAWAPYYYGVWVLEVYGSSLYAGGVFKNVVADGTTYNNAKYVRFGPAVTPPPVDEQPPPAGGTTFSDDFSSNSAGKWSTATSGMTVAGGVATGALPGKIAYLGKDLGVVQPSVDFSARVKVDSMDAGKRVVLMRLMSGESGIADVALRPNGTLSLRNEFTKVDWAGQPVMSAGGWHTIDVQLTVAGTSGRVQVSLDGAPIAKFTGAGNFGTAGVDRIEIGNRTKLSYTIDWDDVAFGPLA